MEKGTFYEEYIKESEKYRERMNDSWLACQKAVQRLPSEQISLMSFLQTSYTPLEVQENCQKKGDLAAPIV